MFHAFVPADAVGVTDDQSADGLGDVRCADVGRADEIERERQVGAAGGGECVGGEEGAVVLAGFERGDAEQTRRGVGR